MNAKVKNEGHPIVLLSPPQADPTQPYSSLPALTGFLRREQYEVIQKDLSIEILDDLLTPKKLEAAVQSATVKARSAETRAEEGYLARFNSVIQFSDYVIDHILEAKEIMRDSRLFYDLKRYKWAFSILSLACELTSLPYYPSKLTLSEYECAAEYTFRALRDATSNTGDNLFFTIFQQRTTPEIVTLNPLLAGISITFSHQIVPAFTLARLIKTTAPHIHVNIGGALMYTMLDHLLEDPTCFEFADSFVIGEGETTLKNLAENLLLNKDLQSIPNLVSEVNGRAAFRDVRWHEDLRSLPCPDYDGLNLERYLAPEPIFFLSSSRGCYHGKCAFCDVAMNASQIYRQQGTDQLTADISELYYKNNARRFFFCDNAMPPRKMLEVVKLVTSTLHDVTWGTEARLEKVLTSEFLSALHSGGCRLLAFGFESASQRVLNAMDKKNSTEISSRILRDCAAHGIAVNLQTFIGFPSETKEEAWDTINFLLENEQMVAQCGFLTFQLQKGTPVYESPERYGLQSITLVDSKKILPSYTYVPSLGMTNEEAQNEELLAIDKLKPVYNARMRFIGALYHLLLFSHYDYDAIYRLWSETDEPLWRDKPDMETLVVRISPNLIVSPLIQQEGAQYRVLCSQTGSQYDLSLSQKELLDHCDANRTVGEVAHVWATRQDQNLGKVTLLAQAFTILREFLRKGLIQECDVYAVSKRRVST